MKYYIFPQTDGTEEIEKVEQVHELEMWSVIADHLLDLLLRQKKSNRRYTE